MEFKDGTIVYTAEGKKAGNLRRVVIDPESKAVTHIVVERGFLFKNDKVIDVAKVAETSEDRVALNCTVDELKEMSPLDIEHYVPLSGTAGGGQYDPLPGGVYSNSAPDRMIKETLRTIPEQLVALKEGARVTSSDDKQVGNIEHLFTEPETGKVTHFIISQGSLSKARKSIPYDWVKMISDDEVSLTVEAQQVDGLPEVQE